MKDMTAIIGIALIMTGVAFLVYAAATNVSSDSDKMEIKNLRKELEILQKQQRYEKGESSLLFTRYVTKEGLVTHSFNEEGKLIRWELKEGEK